MTSRPYPQEYSEELSGSLDLLVKGLIPPNILDPVNSSIAVLSAGDLRDPYQSYQYQEDSSSSVAILVSAVLRNVFVDYNDWPIESVSSAIAILTVATLEVKLISYVDWPIESTSSSIAVLTAGTLV